MLGGAANQWLAAATRSVSRYRRQKPRAGKDPEEKRYRFAGLDCIPVPPAPPNSQGEPERRQGQPSPGGEAQIIGPAHAHGSHADFVIARRQQHCEPAAEVLRCGGPTVVLYVKDVGVIQHR